MNSRGLILLGLLAVVGCGDVVIFESVNDAGSADAVLADRGAACAPSTAAAPQCTGAVAPRVCFENVVACSGSVVEVPVIVQMPPSCSSSLDQGAGITLAPFQLANPQDIDSTVGRCLRREVVDGQLEWAQLSSTTLPGGCPDSFAVGLVDRIQLRVPEDLAAGDYTQTAMWGLIGSPSPECETMLPALGPTIRVVRPE